MLAALLILLPSFARAQESCAPLRKVNSVRMLPTVSGDADMVPVTIAGQVHNFLLDTGGFYSQLSRPLAETLHLNILPSEQQLFDAIGNISSNQARLPDYTLGAVSEKDAVFMISASLDGRRNTQGVEGILTLDRLAKNDLEFDFGSDMLNLFAPDHCAGKEVYWPTPATAVIDIRLQRTPIPADRRAPDLRGLSVYVPVMLEGHEVRALLDTGATNSALRQDLAQTMFGLTLGTPDTPSAGALNGDTSLKTYNHQFKSLRFGDVALSNIRLSIIPDAMARNVPPTPSVFSRTRTERDLIAEPEMILGMDVLRRLHLFIAFGERKLYVTPSTAPVHDGDEPYPETFITGMIARLDTILAAAPDNAEALNDRCFWRAISKTGLDAALADCDKSLALKPGEPQALDSRGFVLFQQGRYSEALAAYNVALNADPGQMPSLWMRGLSKGKLGDKTGEISDLASAKARDPNIEVEFKKIGITTPNPSP